MDYIHLGRSGLLVSRLVLGTMNFGPETTEALSHQIMDRAHDRGVNFFDTANRYGQFPGQTEEIVGRWFATGGGRRDKTVLATKFFGQMGDWPNEGRVSALHIRRACDESLRRLQTDYIDLYQVHHIDRDVPWDEFWEALEVLRYQGKIIYAGSSNFAGWHIAQAQEAAARRGIFGLVSEQSRYNLFERTVELEVLPAAEAYGLGVIPYSPLHAGMLSGVVRGEREGSRRLKAHSAASLESSRDQVERYEIFCEKLGLEPSTVALAWILTRPAVTGPIIGPRTMEQFEGAVEAMGVRLDEDTLAGLEEIFPGHQTAPEDYAW